MKSARAHYFPPAKRVAKDKEDTPSVNITTLGCTLDTAAYPEFAKKARKDLSVEAVRSPNDPAPRRFRVFLENVEAHTMVVPLGWVRSLTSDVHIVDTRPPPRPAPNLQECTASPQPKLRQPEALSAIHAAFESSHNAMLCLAAGGGKTVVALMVAAHYKVQTLVVVHKQFLQDQWTERVRSIVPRATISIVRGPTRDLSGDVVIAMLPTLVNMRARGETTSQTFRSVGLTIVDECFPAEQLVATEFGRRTIESIYEEWKDGNGEIRVWSFDENSQRFVLKRVTHAWRKHTTDELVRIEFDGDVVVRATPNHKMLTPRGNWVCAGDLRADDLLVGWSPGDNEYILIPVVGTSRCQTRDSRVFDLEVEDTHTFVVCVADKGVVAHNCHHIGAEGFTKAMWGLCSPRVLFLTATPRRKDGLIRVPTWFSGPIVFAAPRRGQHGTIVHTRRFTCPEYQGPAPVNRRGDPCHTTLVTCLVENEMRTRVIAEDVVDTFPTKQVLVLTHRRAHCISLKNAIVAAGCEDVTTYMGGDTHTPTTRVVVATFALAAEGMDIPRLDTLVLATPASDVEQACGRVMRGSSGDECQAVIVDWLDDWGMCYGQCAARRRFYVRSGFTFAATTDVDEFDQPSSETFGFED